MKNKIIIIILVVVAGVLAYGYLNKTDTDPAYLAQNIRTSDSVEARYIYNLSQKINQINLTDSIFSNPVFLGLRDNTVDFPQQVSGRNNPFAPIGTDTNIQGQTNQGTSSVNFTQ